VVTLVLVYILVHGGAAVMSSLMGNKRTVKRKSWRRTGK